MADHEDPETMVRDFCNMSGAKPEEVRSSKKNLIVSD
jgi:hypothetical protein